MKICSLFGFFVVLVTLPALAESNHFRVWGGPIASYVPLDMHGKALWSWSNDTTLLVHVVVNANSGSVVDETSGAATVNGQDIALCYRMRPISSPVGQPAPSATFSQVLEYTISGLSISKQYSFSVRRDCQ